LDQERHLGLKRKSILNDVKILFKNIASKISLPSAVCNYIRGIKSDELAYTSMSIPV
jgi:hypothetical protein